MASRHQRIAPVAEYQAYNLTAATTGTDGVCIGSLFDTTSTTAVSAPGSATITLAAFNPLLTVGTQVYIYAGTGTGEQVTITAVNTSTPSITAVFANTHSGTYHVTIRTAVKVGTIFFGALGSTMSLAIWNGLPELSAGSPPATKITTITPANVCYSLGCTVDQGLFVTYTGTTAGDCTIFYLSDPV